jgi:nitroimidazol reductase NimA-like FMN-containing flavoprotein (pyridoxamine 5'-phosphate oxidase superfamily)
LLTAGLHGALIELDLPADPPSAVPVPGPLADLGALGAAGGRGDLMVELADADAVRGVVPDLVAMAGLGVRAVYVTAAGDGSGTDYVLRVFAPAVGIDEDPVTGSAQCLLGPFWAGRLGRSTLEAAQVSARGGRLTVTVKGDRVGVAAAGPGGPAVSPAGAGDEALGGRDTRTTVRRNPAGARYDRRTVHAVLDEAPYCHVGFVMDGAPVVLPTIHDRIDDTLYFHGSRSNRMLRCMTGPAGACVTATVFGGLVLARSVFNHTMRYRSVAVFGHPVEVEDPAAKLSALHHLVEHVLPGRAAEARPPNGRELALTTVLRMPIEEASAKVEEGPPDDDPADRALAVWAGVVPAALSWGDPVADPPSDPDDLPPSVRRLLGR